MAAHNRVHVPRGVEVLLKKASVDADFRRALIERRAAAAGLIGLDLTESEEAMLNTTSEAQLQAIIIRTKVPPAYRKVFLGCAAAAMLAALGVMGLKQLAKQTPPNVRSGEPAPPGGASGMPAPTAVGPDVFRRGVAGFDASEPAGSLDEYDFSQPAGRDGNNGASRRKGSRNTGSSK